MIIPIKLRFLWRPRLPDANDELIMETAANAGANRLVTFNLRHLASYAKEFGIVALTPPAAWKEFDEKK